MFERTSEILSPSSIKHELGLYAFFLDMLGDCDWNDNYLSGAGLMMEFIMARTFSPYPRRLLREA